MYNKRDKRKQYMANKIYDEIKKRISDYPDGTVFFTSDFLDIATLSTIRKCLGRQVSTGTIRRIFDGVYEKPKYSKLLNSYIPADPDKVAHAIAKKYHWTISPCGDVALNKLGLSTQVPAIWSYVSDGPYRDFSWDNITISFKHRSNREISFMSDISITVVEALKALGKEHITEQTISYLQKKLSRKEKETIAKETTDITSWIYEILRKVCLT